MRGKISEEQWEWVKDLIESLYIEQDRTLEDVMNQMSALGIDASYVATECKHPQAHYSYSMPGKHSLSGASKSGGSERIAQVQSGP